MSDPRSTESATTTLGERAGVWHAPLPASTPAPTYTPAALAFGLMLGAWGVVTHWMMTLVGAALVAWAILAWLADLGADWHRPRDGGPIE